MEKNFYEVGKWYGDRVGFPRVGLVNKEAVLIKDSFEFLKLLVDRKRIKIEIQRRNSRIDVKEQIQILSQELEIKPREIYVVDNKHMKGDYAFRVFTQSRVIFRELQQLSETPQNYSDEVVAQFLAGLADAEATVDMRNNIVSFSISNKKAQDAEKIRLLLEKILRLPIKIRTAGKIELKIETPKYIFDIFRDRIGKFMKHPEKLKRLEGKFISKKDASYLNFFKTNNNPKIMAEKFKIHEDSARRIIRQFRKQNLI